MPALEPLMRIEGELTFVSLGETPGGVRLDVPFEGTATSEHWDGELPVVGTDFVTIRGDGSAALDIRARMGEGEDMVGYSAQGRMGADGIIELITFETSSEKFGWLNTAAAVAFGASEGTKLTLDVFVVKA